MQMILEQHLAALGQAARAIRFEVGSELRACRVMTFRRAQSFAHAPCRGFDDIRIRHVAADRIQQAVEILVGHQLALSFFCSILRVRCSVTATLIEDTPKALAISGLVSPSKNRSVKISADRKSVV